MKNDLLVMEGDVTYVQARSEDFERRVGARFRGPRGLSKKILKI